MAKTPLLWGTDVKTNLDLDDMDLEDLGMWALTLKVVGVGFWAVDFSIPILFPIERRLPICKSVTTIVLSLNRCHASL
jgi:hypothetical protein